MYGVLMMAGLIIGIASVTVIIDIGQGAKKSVVERMSRMGFGADAIYIRAGSGRMFRRRGGRPTTLKMNDVFDIASFTFVDYVSPHRSSRSQQFIYKNRSVESSLRGVTPEWLISRNRRAISGRAIEAADVRSLARVAVLGQTVVRNIFGELDPVGRVIRIGKTYFTVVGVLAPLGTTSYGRDRDDLAIIPLTTMLRRVLNSDYLSAIKVHLTSTEMIPLGVKAIRERLRKNHKLPPPAEDDFRMITADELLGFILEQSRSMLLMLTLIACISLFVSGIVIMNIMLVSVGERRQEIGVRRAVGAKRRDITIQFLLESVLISLFGGLMGLLLGQVLSPVISKAFEMPTAPSLLAVALSLGFASAVGLFFGIVPARRAAQFSPVEALR